MKRPRKIPVGWRNLTPSEKIKQGDYWTAKDNYTRDSYWRSRSAQDRLNNPNFHIEFMGVGYIEIYPEAFGKSSKEYPLLLVIRKRN